MSDNINNLCVAIQSITFPSLDDDTEMKDNIKPRDVKSQDIKSQDIKMKDIKLQDIKSQVSIMYKTTQPININNFNNTQNNMDSRIQSSDIKHTTPTFSPQNDIMMSYYNELISYKYLKCDPDNIDDYPFYEDE